MTAMLGAVLADDLIVLFLFWEAAVADGYIRTREQEAFPCTR